jgi:hypothetical protein
MYVSIYVRLIVYVCMYVFYVCTYVCMCLYLCMYVCMFLCVYVCFCVYFYVCIFMCWYARVIHMYIYNLFNSLPITISNIKCSAYLFTMLYIYTWNQYFMFMFFAVHMWCVIHSCLFFTVPDMHISRRIDVWVSFSAIWTS